MTGIRTDIQALRGFAVLVVVLYHAKLAVPAAGYLGVDIFFVISGFLITTLIKQGIERGDFSFSEFYFRRAKRLLPAAYVTLGTTCALAPWFLNSQELRDFVYQMIGAVTFSGNFVLWQQTGYFAGAGDMKPLLHVWSLAVEEQFYFVLPVALVFTPRRYWRASLGVALVASVTLYALGNQFKPVATFYLLPTRAWELLLGSIGAFLASESNSSSKGMAIRWAGGLFYPALAALVFIVASPVAGDYPLTHTAIACTATLIIILRNHASASNTLPFLALSKIGNISYSLYLVHWPIFAFMNNAWVGEGKRNALPIYASLIAVGLSFTLAGLLYRYVEVPLRRAKFLPSWPLASIALLTSIVLVAVTPIMAKLNPETIDFEHVRRATNGLSKACDYETDYFPRRECQTSDQPSVLAWGDSYAMHLVPGLVATHTGTGLAQATRSSCGPLLGLAPVRITQSATGGANDQRWAESCIKFNDSVMEYVRKSETINTVVISSVLVLYLSDPNYALLSRSDTGLKVAGPDENAAIDALRTTVEAIRKTGKRVVLIAPPPKGNFNVGACLERRITGKAVFGAPFNCAIPMANYRTEQSAVLRLLDRVPIAANLDVIKFDPLLCDDLECAVTKGDALLYRDEGHFSFEGSRVMAKSMDLSGLVQKFAR